MICDGCTHAECCPAKEEHGGAKRCSAFKPQEMTNEEWLKQANTEQLAEWLRGVYWHCHEIDCKHCNYPWRCMEKGDIVEWLKQPHLTSK